AESKDVLFVVSAGNELVDIWDTINYPVKFYKENGQIKYFDNTVVVGANSWMKTWSVQADPDYENREFDLLAPFSNFSKKVVDLYAPGVHIYSTVPEGKFRYIGGTSMAAPQVSGIAAILRAYFPSLTAKQVKEILLKSVRTYDNLKVRINDEGKKVLFSNLSKTGGVIDAYNAFLIAEQYTNGN
ncbi:MAG: peptidase S8, partial [Ignavibacteria bacterium]|nr:peptidase S8 [Ignavibacteria bacterium]